MAQLVPDYTVPAPNARPRVVTAAAWLLAAVSAAYLLDVVMLVAGIGGYPDRVSEAMRESGVDSRFSSGAEAFALGIASVTIAITAVAALAIGALAAAVRARSQVGRVLTWVAGGLALMCGLCAGGASGTPAFSGIGYVNAWSNDGSGLHQFSQRLPDGYPPYYRIAATALGVLSMLALITATILLARPAANAWFRKPAPAVPGPYPGYPAPHPGHPVPGYLAPPAAAAPSPHAEPDPAAVTPEPPTIEEIEAALADLDSRRTRGELTDSEYMIQVAHLREQLRRLDAADE
ncbi:hypothetical protein CS0771_33180 [Catellatospora sp. IY07-71]|uniref:hypothetical protein n=1 Tax=Catellatospora sp. IY07-71 TaxID=2728827 RepID=UPI001BB3EE6E|nr:hypothetical protein [Catellatospora sp. IY07-71]BCJ73774.1 hypothetical protein CS0771_33180 [Catellatospora sp. IY07-71]